MTSRFFPCDLWAARASPGFEGVHRSGAGAWGAGATVHKQPLTRQGCREAQGSEEMSCCGKKGRTAPKTGPLPWGTPQK